MPWRICQTFTMHATVSIWHFLTSQIQFPVNNRPHLLSASRKKITKSIHWWIYLTHVQVHRRWSAKSWELKIICELMYDQTEHVYTRVMRLSWVLHHIASSHVDAPLKITSHRMMSVLYYDRALGGGRLFEIKGVSSYVFLSRKKVKVKC